MMPSSTAIMPVACGNSVRPNRGSGVISGGFQAVGADEFIEKSADHFLDDQQGGRRVLPGQRSGRRPVQLDGAEGDDSDLH